MVCAFGWARRGSHARNGVITTASGAIAIADGAMATGIAGVARYMPHPDAALVLLCAADLDADVDQHPDAAAEEAVTAGGSTSTAVD